MDAWQDVKRVLCVRLDTMSGVLLTTPALRALRQSLPGCRLAMLTSPSGAQAARLRREIDAVFRYEALWLQGSGGPRPPDAEVRLIDHFRHGDFDAAVIFTRFAQDPLPAAMLCYLAASRAGWRTPGRTPATSSRTRSPNPIRPSRSATRCGGSWTWWPPSAAAPATSGCRSPCPSKCSWMSRGCWRRAVFRTASPGWSSTPGDVPPRRWPSESFAWPRGGCSSASTGCRVVFSGVEADGALVEGIRAAMDAPSESLAGYLDVAHLAGLLSLAPAADQQQHGPGPPGAAAVGTPVVDIYALTVPDRHALEDLHRVVSREVSLQVLLPERLPGRTRGLLAADHAGRSPSRRAGPGRRGALVRPSPSPSSTGAEGPGGSAPDPAERAASPRSSSPPSGRGSG